MHTKKKFFGHIKELQLSSFTDQMLDKSGKKLIPPVAADFSSLRSNNAIYMLCNIDLLITALLLSLATLGIIRDRVESGNNLRPLHAQEIELIEMKETVVIANFPLRIARFAAAQ